MDCIFHQRLFALLGIHRRREPLLETTKIEIETGKRRHALAMLVAYRAQTAQQPSPLCISEVFVARRHGRVEGLAQRIVIVVLW